MAIRSDIYHRGTPNRTPLEPCGPGSAPEEHSLPRCVVLHISQHDDSHVWPLSPQHLQNAFLLLPIMGNRDSCVDYSAPAAPTIAARPDSRGSRTSRRKPRSHSRRLHRRLRDRRMHLPRRFGDPRPRRPSEVRPRDPTTPTTGISLADDTRVRFGGRRRDEHRPPREALHSFDTSRNKDIILEDCRAP